MLPWGHPRKCPRDIPLGFYERCNQGNYWHMVVALGTCTSKEYKTRHRCVIHVRTITLLRSWKHQSETTDKPIVINMFTSLWDKAFMSSRSLQKGGQIDWLDMKDSTRFLLTYNIRPAFLDVHWLNSTDKSTTHVLLMYTVILLDSSTSIDCVKSYIQLHSVWQWHQNTISNFLYNWSFVIQYLSLPRTSIDRSGRGSQGEEAASMMRMVASHLCIVLCNVCCVHT